MAFDPDAFLSSGNGFDPDAFLEGDKLQEQYGTPGQQAETGARATADILTGGMASRAMVEGAGQPTEAGPFDKLTDVIMGRPHIPTGPMTTQESVKQTLEGQNKANPKARIAGDIAGFLPGILAGGDSLVGGVPGLISKVGGAAARGVESALPKAAGALGRLGVKAATSAAQGMTEGGLFGAEQVATEEGLGDPNLTAQSALNEVGLSTVFGGGLGLGGGLLSGLAKESATALGGKLAEWLPEFEGNRNLKAAGAIQSDIAHAEKRVGREELNKIGREAGEMGLIEKFDSPAAVLEKAGAQMESSGQKMGDILDAADGAPGAAPKEIEGIVGRARKEVLRKMEKNPFMEGAASKLEGLLSRYEDAYTKAGGPGLNFRDLHGIRQEMDAELFGLRGQLDPGATYYKAALRDVRGIVSDEINTGLEKANLSSRAWKEANREYQVAAQIEKFAEKGAQRSTGNNFVSPTEFLGGLAGVVSGSMPMGVILGLGTAAARRYGSGVMGAAARGIRQGETLGALVQLSKANQAVAKKVSELAGSMVSGAKSAAAPTFAKSLVMDRIQQVQQFAQDPQFAQDALAKHTQGLQEHAPQTAQAAQLTAVRGASFLAGKLPAQPVHALGKPLPVPDAQKWTFNRYYEAVNQPTSILQHAAAGTLTPLDVEAVRAVYPELLTQMQTAALEKVTAHKGAVPYRSRLMLSMLLGADLDGTLSSKAIQANQATYQRPSQKSGDDVAAPRPPSSTQGGLAKLKGASRAMTPTQGAETRMGGSP